MNLISMEVLDLIRVLVKMPHCLAQPNARIPDFLMRVPGLVPGCNSLNRSIFLLVVKD